MNPIADGAYRSAFDTGSGYVTFELKIDGTTYTQDWFTDLQINGTLFEDFGVGNVNLRSATAVVADTIHVGKPVEIYATYHLPNGQTYRMLHDTLVVFRSEIKLGQSHILCYDKLCLSEYVFKRTPVWTDRDMLTIVQEIASDLSITLTARATATITSFILPDPGAMTAREVLVEIAKSCGGNFFMTSAGELDFLPVGAMGADILSLYSIVTIDANGYCQVVPYDDLTDSTNVVIIDSNGEFDVIPFSSATDQTMFWGEDANGNDFIICGTPMGTVGSLTKKNTEQNTAEKQAKYDPYVAVILSNDASTWYSPSGLSDAQWEALTETGLVLSVEVEFGSQEIADHIYDQVTKARRYIPFRANGNMDPALELGDVIEVEAFNDNEAYIAASWALAAGQGRLFGELLADGQSEIEILQPYVPKVERMIRREAVDRKASIDVTQDAITAEVSRASESEGTLRTLIQETAEGIIFTFEQGLADAEDKASADLTSYSEAVQQYIRFAQGIIELGERDSQIKAILSSTKLSFIGENGQEAAWISNNQLFINEAVINGKMTLQDINQVHKWIHTIDPNNGHYSGKYIHA